MSVIIAVATGILIALGTTATTYLAHLALARLRALRAARQAAPTAALEPSRRVRHYTLLRTLGSDGRPVQYLTTRPPGSVITHSIQGRPRDFELTDLPLGDGTYAAEPL